MEYIKIQTTILRYKQTFDVTCKPKASFQEFQVDCKLICPVPIKEFIIIFKGKVVQENDAETWNEILKERKVKIMAQSYIEYNDPPAFKRMRTVEKYMRHHERAAAAFFPELLSLIGSQDGKRMPDASLFYTMKRPVMKK